jgi:hypothetical protein
LINSPSFEEDARAALSEVRSAFGRLLDAIPGEVRRAADLQRTLDLDSALAWQVHRASTAPDALDVGRHLPGTIALQRVLDAARSRGVRPTIIDDASQAYAVFQEVVERHAGDRRTFDSMLGAITDAGRGQVDLRQRRAAFRANSHLWGLQARVLTETTVFYPGDSEGKIHVLHITGTVDLRPLRRDVPVSFTGRQRINHDTGGREPIVHAFEAQDPGLVEEFCTQPLPELRFRRAEEGRLEVTIVCPGLGRSGAVTFFRKLLAHNVQGDGPEKRFESNSLVTVPTELQLVDILVPRDWVNASGVRSDTFGCRHNPVAYLDQRADDRLPASDQARHLGQGLSCLRTPDLVSYPGLVEHVLSSLSWRVDEFDVFRVVTRYPILHASTLLTIPAAGLSGS